MALSTRCPARVPLGGDRRVQGVALVGVAMCSVSKGIDMGKRELVLPCATMDNRISMQCSHGDIVSYTQAQVDC